MDWKQILKDLADAGLTQTKIAERCSVAQTTVSELARGVSAEPRFEFGKTLLELHAEVMRPARRRAVKA